MSIGDHTLEGIRKILSDIYTAYDRTPELKASLQHGRAGHKRLYHYTTPVGLQGICEKCVLFATDVRYMNDAAEMSYAYDLFAAAIQSGGSKWDAEFIKSIKIYLDGLSSFYDPVYATCFSEQRDNLESWRAYAASTGGYCIGFDFTMSPFKRTLLDDDRGRSNADWEILNDLRDERISKKEAMGRLRHASQLEECDMIFFNMLYDEDAQKALIQEAFDRLYDLYRVDRSVARCSSAIMSDIALRMKHPAFASEREWRLLVRESDLKQRRKYAELASQIEAEIEWDEYSRKIEDARSEEERLAIIRTDTPDARRLVAAGGSKIKYRMGHMSLRPYVEIPFRRGLLPLVEVVQGPVPLRPEFAFLALAGFLRSQGFVQTDVAVSDVPLLF